ncbi:MAG TPA: Hsp20/alpha crystallin family protein [Chloroflexota bacterium]|nr:Hsp20/alpha crystallin family protein [Chloroflexota bacterium]
MADTASVPVKAEAARPARRDPFDLFNEWQEEMRRYWADIWPLAPLAFRRAVAGTAQAPTPWAPRADVYEKDGAIVVKAELPGVKKEDISITLEAGDLVIRGERKAEHEVKEDAYYRMERTYGSFLRRLPLPEGVDPDKVQATYADGVLEVRVPRPAESKPEPKQIKVA